MDLKTFIKESLIQIDGALKETSETFTEYNYKYGKNVGGNATIDFEVQVYASDASEGGVNTGITVMGMNFGAKGEISNTNHEQSVIKFSVIRENMPEKDKVEQEEKEKTFPRKKTIIRKSPL